jgi:hypothetical protein
MEWLQTRIESNGSGYPSQLATGSTSPAASSIAVATRFPRSGSRASSPPPGGGRWTARVASPSRRTERAFAIILVDGPHFVGVPWQRYRFGAHVCSCSRSGVMDGYARLPADGAQAKSEHIDTGGVFVRSNTWARAHSDTLDRVPVPSRIAEWLLLCPGPADVDPSDQNAGCTRKWCQRRG